MAEPKQARYADNKVKKIRAPQGIQIVEYPWPRPTTRETEVLQLICEGYTSREIAARLDISFKTAVTHRAQLLQKAGVENSIKLFRWALKNGLVSLGGLEGKDSEARTVAKRRADQITLCLQYMDKQSPQTAKEMEVELRRISARKRQG
jgi:DNA-binding CsgD family transcriptional regulator